MTVRPLREGNIDTWRTMRRSSWPDCLDEIHRAHRHLGFEDIGRLVHFRKELE